MAAARAGPIAARSTRAHWAAGEACRDDSTPGATIPGIARVFQLILRISAYIADLLQRGFAIVADSALH